MVNVIAKKTNDTNHIKLGFFVNSMITEIIMKSSLSKQEKELELLEIYNKRY